MAMSLLGNHLWQSTLFAAACALVTLALRNNRAQARHWLWVVASLKFLVPFAALTAIGRELGFRVLPAIAARPAMLVTEIVHMPLARSVVPPSARSVAIDATNWPPGGLAQGALVAVWMIGCVALLWVWAARWRQVGRIAQQSTTVEEGRELAILRRLEQDRAVRRPLPLRVSHTSIEPGVFGVVRPVLLWPQGISGRLDDEQIAAIMSHELSHVARQDNLISLLHMAVQALFWFHPLVWWVGARLVDERERACDEAVIGAGSEPEIYASSILKTCQFSVESPLPCMSGVTGSDLKRRIESIMTARAAHALSAAKRWSLAIAGCAAVAGPFAFGVVNAPRMRAQAQTSTAANPTFEVASVKVNKAGENRVALMMQPGGRLTATNVPLNMLIRFSYQLQDFQVIGVPDWADSERFDVLAKAEQEFTPAGPGVIGPVQLMMRSLLADRFKFTAHMEKREMPIYALVVARSDGRLGPKLSRSTIDCRALMAERGRGGPPALPPPNERPQCGFRIGPGRMQGGGFPLSQFAQSLSGFVQRVVVDRTDLPGDYDIDLTYTPDQMTMGPLKPPPGAAPPPADPDGPSLFTALQEQLGLKLDSTRGQIDVLVIDHAERPTPD